MSTSKSMNQLAEHLEKLPGIGPRKAAELAHHLAMGSHGHAYALADAIREASANSQICRCCRADTDQQLCQICSEPRRNQHQICVVGHTMELTVIEGTGQYNGLYHVLRGQLDPIHGITPTKLEVNSLLQRLRDFHDDPMSEVILATDHTLNGELTAQMVMECIRRASLKVMVTRIAQGLAKGQNIAYADPSTLITAMENRDGWLPEEPEA